MDLVIHQPQHLSEEEVKDIDLKINKQIQEYKKSRTDLIKFSTECMALCTATEARSKALVNQGALQRFCGMITGKNGRIQAANTHNLATAQYAAQKSIVRLSEQNALTMELAVSMGNRVNYIAEDLNTVHQDISTVWNSLSSLAKSTKSNIAELNSRIDNLEQNQKLFFWKETIEDKLFNGLEYCDLPVIHKIVCLASDFYTITKGQWNGYYDLVFLRSVMREIGIDTKVSIKPYDFYKEFLNCSPLYTKLIIHSNLTDRVFESPIHSPILSGVHKLNHLSDDESFIVETVANQLSKASVNADKQAILLDLLENHLNHSCNFNIQTEIKPFDFILELLSGMEVLSTGSLEGALLDSTIEQKDVALENISRELQDKDRQLKISLEENAACEKKLATIQSEIDKRKITERTLIPGFLFDKKKFYDKKLTSEDFDCIDIAEELFTVLKYADADREKIMESKLKTSDSLIFPHFQYMNPCEFKDIQYTQNKTLIKKGDIIVQTENRRFWGESLMMILPAPKDGTIFWLTSYWYRLFPFAQLEISSLLSLDPRVKSYLNGYEPDADRRSSVKNFSYEIVGVISNEYDSTDDIIDWILDKKITLPKSFFSKREDGVVYPKFDSNGNYAKELTYAVK